jgi:hypothetical protein
LNGYDLSEKNRKGLYKRIADDVRKIRATRTRRIWYWSAAAASIALLVVSSLLWRSEEQQPESEPELVVADAFVGKIMPSTEVLLVSGENVTELNHNAHIVLGNNGQAAVLEKSDEAENITTELTLHKSLNKLIVPHGKRSMLQLPDGTKVWLNSGTEFEFPSEFTGNTREVSVKGEIYIEVAKADGKPFFVNSPQMRVQVTGTKFNVSAYPDYPEKTVVLVEGAVDVDVSGHGTSRLIPGELFTADSAGITRRQVNVSEYTSWKDGVLVFSKTSIHDVLKQIGRYYNVDFKDNSDEKLSSKTCTGKLFLSDNLDEVFQALSVISSTAYYKENNIYIIKKK